MKQLIERIEKELLEADKLIFQMEKFGFHDKVEYFRGRYDTLCWISEFIVNCSKVDFENEIIKDKAISLLRDLADHQNGVPLETEREDYEKTIYETYEFLKKYEK